MNIIRTTLVIALASALMVVGLIANAQVSHAASAAVTQSSPQQAGTVRLLRPTHRVKRLWLTYFEIDGDFANVGFNNGSAWRVAACRLEDSERCFWDAGSFGYGRGDSFVRMYHHTFYEKDMGPRTYRVGGPIFGSFPHRRILFAWFPLDEAGSAQVQFNNGATWVLRPCSRRVQTLCWRAGGRHHASEVRMFKRTYKVRPSQITYPA